MSAGTAANVTTGKRRVDGGIYIAPANTTLPTDAKTTLANTFVNVGYISEDGATNSRNRTVQDIKEWGGATVDSSTTEFKNEWKFKMIESLNINALKLCFGDSNVTEASDKITTKINADELDERVVVIDTAVKGNKLKRIVIPRGKITAIGDTVYKGSEAVAFDVTLSTYANASGDYQYEYIEAAAT